MTTLTTDAQEVAGRVPNVETYPTDSVRLAGLMAVAEGDEAKRQSRLAYSASLIRESRDLADYIIRKRTGSRRAALAAMEKQDG